MNTTAVIEHQKVGTIISNVDQARQEVAEAFRLLVSAKERLGLVLGDKDYNGYAHLWNREISDYNLPQTAQACDTAIAQNTWRYLLRQTGMYGYMTEKRKDELEKQILANELPALSVANVLSTLEGLTSQLGPLLLESVKEVFDWLRPQRSKYKTNKKFGIGEKVIIGWLIQGDRTGYQWFNYGQEQKLRALGNVFSLLDGKGIPQYPDDLCTQFRIGFDKKIYGEWFDLPYMSAKIYGNGNTHFRFTRPDLVARLNQLGSDGSIGTEE